MSYANGIAKIDKLTLPALKYHYKNLKETCGFSFEKSFAMQFAEELAEEKGNCHQCKRQFYIAYIRNWVSFYWKLSKAERPKMSDLTLKTLHELGYDQPRFL